MQCAMRCAMHPCMHLCSVCNALCDALCTHVCTYATYAMRYAMRYAPMHAPLCTALCTVCTALCTHVCTALCSALRSASYACTFMREPPSPEQTRVLTAEACRRDPNRTFDDTYATGRCGKSIHTLSTLGRPLVFRAHENSVRGVLRRCRCAKRDWYRARFRSPTRIILFTARSRF